MPELTTEPAGPFLPADVLTVSITRARVEALIKEIESINVGIDAPHNTTLDILYYLRAAVLADMEPSDNEQPPLQSDGLETAQFMPVEEMVKPEPNEVYTGPGTFTPSEETNAE